MASSKMEDKCKQNKIQYESTVDVGKSLYVLILQCHYNSDPSMSDLNNMSNTKLDKLFNQEQQSVIKKGVHVHMLDDKDLSLLHKLVFYMCDHENKEYPAGHPAPELQKHLKELKDNRNYFAHDKPINTFTDLFIWRKIEELRVLFQKILLGIQDVYQTVIKTDVIDKTKKEINDKLDKILEKIVVSVTDLEIGSFLVEIQEIGKCPFKVMIEIKESPEAVPELLGLLQRIATAEENTKVTMLVNKAYFDGIDLQGYDSDKYLTPLLDENSKCKLIWYRGTLSNQMITVLPATLEQLYIRMRWDQLKHLKEQLPKLPELMSLGLYLDFTEEDNCYGFDTIDLSSLPQLGYKGKQLGLRFCGNIAIDNISLVVQVIKTLTKDHQCDTLEFYKTHLETGEDIERLLQELHTSEIHVTTWVKLQNHANEKDSEQELYLNNLAKTLNLKMFKFLQPICDN